MHRTLQLLALAAASTLITEGRAQDLGDPNCDTLWLVSGYNSGVHVYDGCSGAYIQNLDSQGTLLGPQAIAEDGQGGLIVVSEINGRLLRFDRRTLAFDRVVAGDDPATQAIEPAPVANPTGLTITPGGRWFVGSFSEQRVVELDPATGQVIGVLVAPGQGVTGPDTGMWLEGDSLYVPGFDSNSIARADISQANSGQILVGPGSNGLNAPRTVLIDDQGDLLSTSWRGGQIMAFDPDSGAFKRVVASLQRPTGMVLESPGVVLVTSDQLHDVKRVRVSDGTVLATPVPARSGGLDGATWIHVLQKLPAMAEHPATDTNAFFLVGVGDIVGNTIVADPMFHTTGGLWGADLDPDLIEELEWGTLTFEFDGCSSGTMSYVSDSAEFGAGGYEVVRLAASPVGDDCEAAGFGNTDDARWMSGHWYGGLGRAGEGFSIDVINGDIAILTWYSYLPAALVPLQ